MRNVFMDVNAACDIVSNDKNVVGSGYSKIFCSSNENLKELFKVISVEDKEVLSVLSSGDQYFYSYYNGAKNVDTFDRNYLTKHYYYIRKWNIKYLGKFYPDFQFLNNTTYIKELLKLVECSDMEEREAYLFWKTYADRIQPLDNRKLFYSGFYNRGGITDMDKLEDIVDKKLVFFHGNIKNYPSSNNKRYDVIILSNILEYCDSTSIESMRDRLYRLLNYGGIIVCSRIVTDKDEFDYQRSVFSRVFDYRKLLDSNLSISEFPLGYVYTKKC